jgi:lipoprotein NlpD
MILLLIAVLFPACSAAPLKTMKADQARGVYHRVKSGETLFQISRAYNVALQELAEANNIEDPNRLEAGAVIFIPDARQVIDDVMKSLEARRTAADRPSSEAAPVLPTAPATGDRLPAKPPLPESVALPAARTTTSMIRIAPLQVLASLSEPRSEEEKETPPGTATGPPARAMETAALDKPAVAPQDVASRESPETAGQPVVGPSARAVDPKSVQFDRKRFVWPVKGKVVSRFGIQPNGMYKNGIMIAAGQDAPVVAAAKGVVIFLGLLPGYGETIIIMHGDHYATVYTHLGRRIVKVEDRVNQGDLIGYLGRGDEKAGSPRLNFEIRHQNKARNPMFFLP